jgi:hypothetical protein
MVFLTSDFEMLTALIPIRTEKNSFWRSSKGMELIEIFLNRITCISDIDQHVVITQDDRVCRLALEQGIQISSAAIPGSPDRPYTFEQTRSLARNFQYICKNQNDALILADHRNLFLTADDITRALAACQQGLGNGVMSLSFCRDYPCQFKAFFIFLGCVIIRVNGNRAKNGTSNKLQVELPGEFACKAEGPSEIIIRVSCDDRRCKVSFNSKNIPVENYIAQILPFNKNGPLYKKSQEILIKTPEHESQLEIDSANLKGVIFSLTMPAHSGEYDTLELFTPENATWELGESISTVFSKKNHKPMYGRQEFPPAYTYDGSLCILSARHLPDEFILNPIPLVIKDSCIVTDWLDYWYTVTAQQRTAELEF